MGSTTRQSGLRHFASIAGGTLVLGWNPRPALSASNGLATCSGPVIVAQGALSSGWIQAVEDVSVRMRKNSDLDRCAELRFESRQNGLQVQVTTSGGRTAVRLVTDPPKLLSTVEALTELPPVLPSAPPSIDPRELPDDRVDQPPDVRSAPVSTAHIEVGAGAGARLAGGPLYGGGGVAGFAELALERWLIGVTARWDAVDGPLTRPGPSGFKMQTFEVGIGLGRRVSLGEVNLDGVLGPEVVVESQEAEGLVNDIRGTASDVRFDFLLRMSAPRTGHTRFYAGADADLSPSRVRRTKQLDPGLPALPAWSSGLQIGILWGGH